VGQRIKEHRVKAGLDQRALGKLVGVSCAAVSFWETGTTNITLANAVRVARALNTSLDELTEGIVLE
jgi:transcriptional regulator with XRE-family HTH domain